MRMRGCACGAMVVQVVRGSPYATGFAAGTPPRRKIKIRALRSLEHAHELTVTTQTRFRSAP